MPLFQPTNYVIHMLAGSLTTPYGQPDEIAAEGGSIINTGSFTIYVSPRNNPLDDRFLTAIAPGGVVPWPKGLPCFAWCLPFNGPSAAQVVPFQMPFSPGTAPTPETGLSVIIGNTVGAPTSGGPYAVDDLYVDSNEVVWLCTVAGSPGTWTLLNPSNPNLLFNSTGSRGVNNGSLDGWITNAGNFTSQNDLNGSWVTNFAGAPVVITDVGNTGSTQTADSNNPISVTQGQTYTLSGLLSTAGTSCSIIIQSYDGTSWTTQASATVTSANPTKVQCSYTVGSGIQQIRVRLQDSGDGNSNFALLKLEQGGKATPWQESVIGAPWTPYTPSIGGTGWVLGNGSIVGSYRFFDTHTVGVWFRFAMGTTTTVGSGNLTIALPSGVAPKEDTAMPLSVYNGVYQQGVGLLEAGATVIIPQWPTSTANVLGYLDTQAGDVNPVSNASCIGSFVFETK